MQTIVFEGGRRPFHRWQTPQAGKSLQGGLGLAVRAQGDAHRLVAVPRRSGEERRVDILPPFAGEHRINPPTYLESHLLRPAGCVQPFRNSRCHARAVAELPFPEVRDRLRVEAEGHQDVLPRYLLKIMYLGAFGEEDEFAAGGVGDRCGEERSQPSDMAGHPLIQQGIAAVDADPDSGGWAFSRHHAPERTPSALKFGSAIHRSVETFYRPDERRNTGMDEVLAAYLDAWEAPEEAPIHFNKDESPESLKAMAERMLGAFPGSGPDRAKFWPSRRASR